VREGIRKIRDVLAMPGPQDVRRQHSPHASSIYAAVGHRARRMPVRKVAYGDSRPLAAQPTPPDLGSRTPPFKIAKSRLTPPVDTIGVGSVDDDGRSIRIGDPH
jgi:hypothetical protein